MMRYFILALLFLVSLSGYSQLVSEETKDVAYLASDQKLTGKKWFTCYGDKKGTILFNADGTYQESSIIKDGSGEFNQTHKGKWTRRDHMYLKLEPVSTTFTAVCVTYGGVKYEDLSERKKAEAREHCLVYTSQSKYPGNKSGNLAISYFSPENYIARLDDNYLVFGHRDGQDYRSAFCTEIKLKRLNEEAERKKTLEDEQKAKQQVDEQVARVANELDDNKIIQMLSDSLGGEPIYAKVDAEAKFPGGDAAFYNYMVRRVRYPLVAMEDGAQGTVYVKCVILKNGEIGPAIVSKSIHPALDKEALRLVKKMPEFTPAKKNGVSVNSIVSLPVRFSLQ